MDQHSSLQNCCNSATLLGFLTWAASQSDLSLDLNSATPKASWFFFFFVYIYIYYLFIFLANQSWGILFWIVLLLHNPIGLEFQGMN